MWLSNLVEELKNNTKKLLIVLMQIISGFIKSEVALELSSNWSLLRYSGANIHQPVLNGIGSVIETAESVIDHFQCTVRADQR